jgi:two-component sensor histidine kinase
VLHNGWISWAASQRGEHGATAAPDCNGGRAPAGIAASQLVGAGWPRAGLVTSGRLLRRNLVQRQPLLAAVNLTVGLAVLAVLSGSAPPVALDSWFAYLATVQAGRVLFWSRARRRRKPERGRFQALWLTSISAAAGIAWGLAGLLFGADTGPAGAIFIPFVLAGMAAGSITALPAHPPSFFTFVWAALTPYAALLALQPQPVMRVMALVTLLYAAGISVMGWQAHRTLRLATELNLQNAVLVRRLERSRRGLETMVAQRTLELQATNASLTTEVAERRRSEQHRELLLREMSHRVKNLLAMVAAIARQTEAGTDGDAHDFVARFSGRLQALAGAHELLIAGGWQGTGLAELAGLVLRPYLEEPGGERLRLHVEDVPLGVDVAQNLALVLHELATNAVKHGALSVPGGQVDVDGRLVVAGEDGGRRLELSWSETGGPVVRPPTRRGFGTSLLQRAIALQHDGEVRLDWRPEGLVCRIALAESEALAGTR